MKRIEVDKCAATNVGGFEFVNVSLEARKWNEIFHWLTMTESNLIIDFLSYFSGVSFDVLNYLCKQTSNNRIVLSASKQRTNDKFRRPLE